MNRHILLLAVGAVVLLGVAAGPAAAQDGLTTIDGQLVASDGEPVRGATVVIYDGGLWFTTEADRTTTGSDGRFSLSVLSDQNGSYDIVLLQRNTTREFPHDGVPDVHAVRTDQPYTGDVGLGTIELPQPETLNLSVTREGEGSVADGAVTEVDVLSERGGLFFADRYGYGPTTTDYRDGEAVFGSTKGIEVAGKVRMQAHPTSKRYNASLGLGFDPVTDESAATLTLSENESYEPPAPGVAAAERTVDSDTAAPGATVSVSVDATATGTVTINESFEGAVGGASITDVTVNGESASPAVSAADGTGVVVSVADVPADSSVTVGYEVTAAANASSNASIAVGGQVTAGETVALGTATLDVAAGSPLDGVAGEYDSNLDGEIDIGEIGAAASDYADGELGLSELSQVATAFAA